MAARRLIAVLGTLMIVLGLLFAGQGSGLFPYPAASIMIDQTPWVWRGLSLALVGIVVLAFSRRVR